MIHTCRQKESIAPVPVRCGIRECVRDTAQNGRVSPKLGVQSLTVWLAVPVTLKVVISRLKSPLPGRE